MEGLKVVINNFVVDNECFIITQDKNGLYWAFDSKDIDSEGRLTRVYNGLQGHVGHSLNETLCGAYISAKTNALDREKLKNGEVSELHKLAKIAEEGIKKFPYAYENFA